MTALLVDIGGTKTQLAFLNQSNALQDLGVFSNSDYDSFSDVLHTIDARNLSANALIVAVAGPVDNGRFCQMTNCDWAIDSSALETEFTIPTVHILNDLQATAWGMTDPDIQKNLLPLSKAFINFHLPVVLISPGTGLGQTCIRPANNTFQIHATEGGHKTIAPFNTLCADLIHQHWHRYGTPISWENWFSGSGLGRLYESLHPGTTAPSNEVIGQSAQEGKDDRCVDCMNFFTQGIYAEAGNLALQYLAWGGIIIAGGIPPKVDRFFKNPENIRYVIQKNEYIERLKKIPIALSYQQNAPLIGAKCYYQQILGS